VAITSATIPFVRATEAVEVVLPVSMFQQESAHTDNGSTAIFHVQYKHSLVAIVFPLTMFSHALFSTSSVLQDVGLSCPISQLFLLNLISKMT